MQLLCGKCKCDLSTRIKPYRFITFMCRNCGILIVYVDGTILYKTKQEYIKWRNTKTNAVTGK